MQPEDISLAGKTAVVTGAGAGIGTAIARTFANFGAWVGVLDKDEPAAERIAASIRESGGEALALTTDVTQRQDVAAAAGQVLSETQRRRCAGQQRRRLSPAGQAVPRNWRGRLVGAL